MNHIRWLLNRKAPYIQHHKFSTRNLKCNRLTLHHRNTQPSNHSLLDSINTAHLQRTLQCDCLTLKILLNAPTRGSFTFMQQKSLPLQIVRSHALTLRQMVSGRSNHIQPIRQKRLYPQSILPLNSTHHRQIKLIRHQKFFDYPIIRYNKRNMNTWIASMKATEQRRHKIGSRTNRCPKQHTPTFKRLNLAHHHRRLTKKRKQTFRLPQNLLPCRRQHNTSPTALKQTHTQRLFQRPHLLRNSRLREIQILRRPSIAEMPGHRTKDSQLMNRKIALPIGQSRFSISLHISSFHAINEHSTLLPVSRTFNLPHIEPL